MCNDAEAFENLNKEERIQIYTVGKRSIAVGFGDLHLTLKPLCYKNRKVKLQDILYVPELRNNLLSVPSITVKGYTVTFGKDRIAIKRNDGFTVLTATKQNRLYIVGEAPNYVYNVKRR